jgi:hypothetical protein
MISSSASFDVPVWPGAPTSRMSWSSPVYQMTVF